MTLPQLRTQIIRWLRAHRDVLDEVETLRAKNTDLKLRLEKLQREKGVSDQAADRLRDQKSKLTKQVAEQRRHHESYQKQIDELAQKVASLREELEKGSRK